ncbi:SDR family oxidoreductase [Amorphoplanes nipponensis]|uniref:3-oxoacyl-ACP reductase n=1 Tax=Actinoplanes nipponensis TaxID=135950 RepID=A0A919JF90_9ACTN|nr:SDR family oxidoreductase [Actinoplanes nipponensis]GIE47937.1 3-oxoacyl-ACP reductase [Actinoplanes nipponensis]
MTGGSRGIGRAIVERLARDGATVVFGYRSRDEEAKAVEAAVPRARGFRADLAEPGAMRELLERADRLDILVANAAAAFVPTPIAEVTDEEYDRVFAVNARSTFQAVRHAARHMRDHGRIIAISTLNTTSPAPGGSLYVGSKGAVEQFVAVAARELGARGITVNAVSPGATDTELLRSTNSAEALARMPELTPLGRLGRPEDIADVVAFLAGPDGRWITGQNIHAGGGLA